MQGTMPLSSMVINSNQHISEKLTLVETRKHLCEAPRLSFSDVAQFVQASRAIRHGRSKTLTSREVQEIDVDIGGIPWRLRDLPGQAGKHSGNKTLKVDKFLEHYKVCQDSTHAVMFVMSATRRDRLDNLVAAVRKACRAKPIFLVITSASGCMKERHESNIYATRKACGIPKHPHIRMDPIFAIDVPWPDCKVAADPARLQQQLLEHCARFDFPDLLLHLGAPQMEAPTLLVQVQLTPALAAAVEEVLDNVGDANAQSGGKGEQGVNHGKKNGSETQLAHKLVQIGLGGLILGLKAFEITLS